MFAQRLLSLAIGLLLVASSTWAQTVRYVRPGGTGDGTTWAKAAGDLQTAITAAASAATAASPAEVWVAAGTYQPASWPNGGSAARDMHFALRNNVAVYGGFPNTGSATKTDRNPVTYPSILSGDLGGNDADANSDGFLDAGTLTDNVYHLFYHPAGTGLDGSAILDGFVLSGGNANGSAAQSYGGAMYTASGLPTLVNCVCRQNTASADGGALYNSGSPLSLTNCLFWGNQAGALGGAISNATSSPSLTNCTFWHNQAGTAGGALANDTTSLPAVTNSIFWNNGDQISAGTESKANFSFNIIGLADLSNFTGSGNLNSDPSFADTSIPDLRVNAGSPAINAGNQYALKRGIATDLWGNQRLRGGQADIGAYEYPAGSLPAPSGLSASKGTYTTKVALTWTAIAGTYYQIWRAPLNGTPAAISGWQQVTTYDDDTAAADTIYNYYLKAASSAAGADLSELSETDTGWLVSLTPTYRLTVQNGTGSGTYTVGMVVPVTAATATAGMVFDRWIGSVSYVADATAASSTVTMPAADITIVATYKTRPDLQAPTLLAATQGTYATKVALTWAATSYATHYQVLRATSPSATKVAISAWQTGTSYDDDTAVAGTLYYYAVAAATDATGANPSPASATAIGWAGTVAGSGPVYVRADGTGNGSSWSSALNDLQAAIELAAARATATVPVQVWVAAGTYKPSSAPNPATASLRAYHFSLRNNVAVYGGFPASGTPVLSDRAPATYATILSGDIGTAGDSTDNSYHVLYLPAGLGLTASAVLDGVTIVGGQADGSGIAAQGAGLYSDSNSPTLTSCTFTGNRASSFGGAVYNRAGSPVITSGSFLSNVAEAGAGIYNAAAAAPRISSSVFRANTASGTWAAGGAICNNASAPILTSVTFSDNTASVGGAICNWGASSPSISAATFSTNTAKDGGAVYNDLTAAPQITTSTFAGNTASNRAGAVYVQYQATLTNNRFWGNGAARGGALYMDAGAKPVIANSAFWSNGAITYGGALYNGAKALTSIVNNTFYGNGASSPAVPGAAVYNDASATPVITNNVFFANGSATGLTAADEIANGDVSKITYNFIGLADISAFTGAGNVNGNPLFVDAASRNFRLQSNSPCRESGLAAAQVGTLDLDGNLRLVGGTTDLGAYEYQAVREPTGLIVSDGLHSNRINVAWTAVAGATHYQIYRATSTDVTKAVVIGAWQVYPAAGFDDTTAARGTTYQYWVRAAMDASGGHASGDTGPGQGSLKASTYYLTVTEGTGSGEYLPGTVVAVAANDKTAQGYMFSTWTGDTGLLAGGNATLIATTLTMPSGHPTVTATYLPVPTPPATVTASTDDPDKVVVSWSAVAGAAAYQVWRRTDSSAPAALSGWVTSTSYNDTAAVPGVTYYYSVYAALTASGGGASLGASAEAAGKLLRYTLTVVAGIDTSTATNTALYKSGEVATIQANTPPIGQIFYNWTSTGGTLGSSTATPTTLTMPAADVTVTANCAPPVPPAAPAGVTASDDTYTHKVKIDWTVSSGATHYQVYRATSATALTKDPLGPWQASTTFDDTTAVAGTTYYYWVRAATDFTGSAPSGYSSYDSGRRSVGGDTVYVRVGGTGDGTTWDKAMGNVQNAIEAAAVIASATGKAANVWIAKGTYHPTTWPNGGSGEQYVHFSLRNKVTVRGGFPDTGSPTYPEDWDPVKNPTVLSGDLSDNDYLSIAISLSSLAITTTFSDRISIRWNAVDGAPPYYRVYRADIPNVAAAQPISAWQTSTAFNDTDPALKKDGTPYYYWVRSALSSSGAQMSTFVGPVTGQLAVGTYHLTVTDDLASSGEYAAGAAVPVTAPVKTGATFSRWTSTGGTLADANAASTTLTMPAGHVTLTPLYTGLAGTPTSVVAAQGGAVSSINVSWAAVVGASHYQVSRATSPTGTKTIVAAWQAGTSYTDNDAGLVGTAHYYYWVQAAFDNTGTGISMYSSPAEGWLLRYRRVADYDRTSWDDRDGFPNASVLTDNAYHVFYHPNGMPTPLDATASLDGVTLTGGYANGPDYHANGGAMFNYASSPTITNCTFTRNLASSWGGAVENYEGSNTSFSHCAFIGNTAGANSGAVDTDGADVKSVVTFSFCTFYVNRSYASVGASGVYNGSTGTHTNCTFVGNIADTTGAWSGTRINCIVWNNGDQTDASDPLLLPLGYYGDTVMTMPPSAGSPAYGQGAWVPQATPGAAYIVAKEQTCRFNPSYTFELIALAEGTGLKYQWYEDDALLPGDINQRLNRSLGIMKDRVYKVVITYTDAAGKTASISAQFKAYAVASPIRVSTTGNDTLTYDANGKLLTGTTWANAYRTVQKAVDYAGYGCELWVAAGTYTINDPDTLNTATNQCFRLRNGVDIYGGFTGTESFRGERRPATNITTLSAVGTGVTTYNVIAQLPGGTLLDSSRPVYDTVSNTWNLVEHPELDAPDGVPLDASAVLDGFTITGGNGTGVTYWGNDGGGLYTNSSSPTVRNCTFSANSCIWWGGAVYINNAQPLFSNCTFNANSAGNGGAVYSRNGSNATFSESVFTSNSAGTGGAMTIMDAMTVYNCRFGGLGTGNSATGNGGAVLNSGAGLFYSCEFTCNSAGTDGGAMSTSSASLKVVNCTFASNVCGVTSVTSIDGSSSQGYGTAIFAGTYPRYSAGTVPFTATNCIFYGNTITKTASFVPWYVAPTDPATPLPTLTVTYVGAPAGVGEADGLGATQVTVTRTNGDNSLALTVRLSIRGTNRVAIPATVVIPATVPYTDHVTFDLDAIDNALFDGNEEATITATATGYISGTATLQVLDDETNTLVLVATKTSFTENAANPVSVATVWRSDPDISAPMIVNIANDTPGRITVPNSVTIPAGLRYTTFNITVTDNTLGDGNATITLTASDGSGTGATPATLALALQDNELAVTYDDAIYWPSDWTYDPDKGNTIKVDTATMNQVTKDANVTLNRVNMGYNAAIANLGYNTIGLQCSALTLPLPGPIPLIMVGGPSAILDKDGHIATSRSGCVLEYQDTNKAWFGYPGSSTTSTTGHLPTDSAPITNWIADPRYANAATGDWRLAWNSWEIDQAINAALSVPPLITVDAHGDPRIINGLLDRGAYEYNPYYNNATGAGTGPVLSVTAGTGTLARTQNVLSWTYTPVTGTPTAYRIDRSFDPLSYGWTQIKTVTSGTTDYTNMSFTDTQLQPNTLYWYRVTAVHAPGNTPWSNSVWIITAAKADPTGFTWPTASTLTYGQALRDSPLVGGSASVPGTFAWEDLSIRPPVGLSTQTVIFTPTDSVNYNTKSGTVSIQTNLTFPTVITADKGVYTNKINVTWNTVAGASHYQLLRGDSSVAVPTVIQDWTTAQTYVDTTGLNAFQPDGVTQQTYYYYLKAATSAVGTNASVISAPATGWLAANTPTTGVVYVRVGGTGDGSNWDTALGSVQDGIDKAATYGSSGQVWIAAGSYLPTSWPNGGSGTREKHFALHNKVTVLGGFPASGQPVFADRDPAKYPTILSGDLNGDDDDANRDGYIDTDLMGDNCYHVFNHPAGSGLDATAILDGVTIRGGHADGTGDSTSGVGAGMYDQTVSPTLVNVTFTYNRALTSGAGMYNTTTAAPSLSACTFVANIATAATSSAGAVYNDGSAPNFMNCTLSANRANFGGAMYNANGATPNLVNCALSSNYAMDAGGAMYNHNAAPVLLTCSFDNNQATTSGGAMFNSAGATPSISYTKFTGNTATTGGAMFSTAASPTLLECAFAANSARYDGGAMYNTSAAAPVVTNTKFSTNVATFSGGAMYNSASAVPVLSGVYFYGNTAAYYGGAMRNTNASPQVVNSAFESNTVTDVVAGSGGGMYNDSVAKPAVINCTFWKNQASVSGGGMYNDAVSAPTIANSIFWNSSNGEIAGSGPAKITYTLYDGTVDPLFSGSSFRLQEASPARNAGLNSTVPVSATTDLDGNARIQETAVDLGACEYTGTPAPRDLTATAISSWEIDLSWTDASGETGYEIDRRLLDTPDSDWAIVATLGAGVTSYKDTALPPGTTYYYRVRGVFAAGNGAWSRIACATTPLSTKVTPEIIAWPTLPILPLTGKNLYYGQTLSAAALTGGQAMLPGTYTGVGTGTAIPGTFTYESPSFVPDMGTYLAEVTFTPTDTATYNAVTGTLSVTIGQALPTVTTWPTATAIIYGQTLASATLVGGSAANNYASPAVNVPGTFTYDVPATAPTVAQSPFTAAVTFTPADTVNYLTVAGTVTVLVNQATPAVTAWPIAKAISYGEALSVNVSPWATDGTASVPGLFTYVDASVKPATAGVYTAAVLFTPTDTTNYTTVSSSISVPVNQSTGQVVTVWPVASAITYGQTLASSQLTGGVAAVPGTFTFDKSTDRPIAGSYVTDVTFTPDDPTNYPGVSGTGKVVVPVNKATPAIIWPTASQIKYGQTLADSSWTVAGIASNPYTGAQLNGAFDFAPADLAASWTAGFQSPSVIFTPVDLSNYVSVTGTVSVYVDRATPVVTWPTASGITLGQALSASTISGGSAANPDSGAAVTGAFTFVSPTTVPATTGNYSAQVLFTPTDTTNYNTVTGTASVAVTGVLLTVQSSPVTGLVVTGTQGGTCNYQMALGLNTAVSVAAPATQAVGGKTYTFQQWLGYPNGAVVTDSGTSLAFSLTVDTTLTAVYVEKEKAASLQVTLTPAAAITAGAQWSIDGGTTWQNSGTTLADLIAGNYTLKFKDISGKYFTPAIRALTLAAGQNAVETAAYLTWPAAVDFNNDGKSDLVWQADDGSIDLWYMDGTTKLSSSTLTPPGRSDWTVVGLADFDLDGAKDLLVQNSSGTVAILYGTAGQQTWTARGAYVFSGSTTWRVTTVTDLNTDSYPDLVWKSPEGAVVVWNMQDATLLSSYWLSSIATTWRVAGIADIDADGHKDILWLDTDGTAAVWYMQDGQSIRTTGTLPLQSPTGYTLRTVATASDATLHAIYDDGNGQVKSDTIGKTGKIVSDTNISTTVSTGVHVAAAGDADGDGDMDLIVQDARGQATLWQLQSGVISTMVILSLPTVKPQVPVGAADFNGDGLKDVVWQDADGKVGVYYQASSGTAPFRGSAVINSASTTWRVKAVADFDIDGQADLLWQDPDGKVAVWYMTKGTATPNGSIGWLNKNATTWQVVGAAPFNTSGNISVLWQNTDGSTYIWYIDTKLKMLASSVFNLSATGDRVISYADFDNDYIPDTLCRTTANKLTLRQVNSSNTVTTTTLVSSAPTTTAAIILGVNTSGTLAYLWLHDTFTGDVLQAHTFNPPVPVSQQAIDVATYDDRRVVAAADLNSDGVADLVWQDSTGKAGAWLLSYNSQTSTSSIATEKVIFDGTSTWKLAQARDVDGDGKPDLIWRSSEGMEVAWLMSGVTPTGNYQWIYSGSTTWKIVACGDLDHDGTADLVWQDSSGIAATWFWKSGAIAGTNTFQSSATTDRVATVGDYNNDGHPDIVWQTAANGTVTVWYCQSGVPTGVKGTLSASGNNAMKLVGP